MGIQVYNSQNKALRADVEVWKKRYNDTEEARFKLRKELDCVETKAGTTSDPERGVEEREQAGLGEVHLTEVALEQARRERDDAIREAGQHKADLDEAMAELRRQKEAADRIVQRTRERTRERDAEIARADGQADLNARLRKEVDDAMADAERLQASNAGLMRQNERLDASIGKLTAERDSFKYQRDSLDSEAERVTVDQNELREELARCRAENHLLSKQVHDVRVAIAGADVPEVE